MLWGVVLAWAQPCVRYDEACLDAAAERIADRLRAGGAFQEGSLMRILCTEGMELACLLRREQVEAEGPLSWTDGPCVVDTPCPEAEGMVVVAPADRPAPANAFWSERRGDEEVALLNREGAVVQVVPDPPEGVFWELPGPDGAAARCGRDRTITMWDGGGWRPTGARCGMARWDIDGERLWVQAGGALAEVTLEGGVERTWWIPCDPSSCRIVGAGAGHVWFGDRGMATVDRPGPMVRAGPADGLAGPWRRGRHWLWVAPEVAHQASQHRQLVLARGELPVLDGDVLLRDGERWHRRDARASKEIGALPGGRGGRVEVWAVDGVHRLVWDREARSWTPRR